MIVEKLRNSLDRSVGSCTPPKTMPLRLRSHGSSITDDMNDSTHRSFGEQARHYFTRTHTKLPDAPIESPAAWLGKDLREQEAIWRVRLSDEDLAEFDAGLDRLERDGIAIEKINRSSLPLPRLSARIESWRHELMQGRGFVVVSGFPVER